MVKYFEDKKFYVQNDEKFIYEVKSFEVWDGYTVMRLNLELIAGWDYINPDYSDEQGYVPANRFVEDLQSETVAQYFTKESSEEALNANGFVIIEALPERVKKILKDRK